MSPRPTRYVLSRATSSNAKSWLPGKTSLGRPVTPAFGIVTQSVPFGSPPTAWATSVA